MSSVLYIYFQTCQPEFLIRAELFCHSAHRPLPRKIGFYLAHFLPVSQLSVNGAEGERQQVE